MPCFLDEGRSGGERQSISTLKLIGLRQHGPMGRWVREPDLLSGEKVVWRRNANREQTPLRQVGGRLFLTNHRLLFVPNRFDDATGGDPWSCTTTDIAAVAVEPSRSTLPFFGWTAQLRRRLRVEPRAGDAELFVVNRVENAASTLRAAMELAKPGLDAPDPRQQ